MESFKRKVWCTFSYEAEITYNETWKLQDVIEPYNETTSQGDEKNDKKA